MLNKSISLQSIHYLADMSSCTAYLTFLGHLKICNILELHCIQKLLTTFALTLILCTALKLQIEKNPIYFVKNFRYPWLLRLRGKWGHNAWISCSVVRHKGGVGWLVVVTVDVLWLPEEPKVVNNCMSPSFQNLHASHRIKVGQRGFREEGKNIKTHTKLLYLLT